jgi:diguanylate cyclase (GGDEF)-like protein
LIDSVCNAQTQRRFRTRTADASVWVLVDVDGLKQINDDRGHAAGDEVLRTAARATGVTMRVTDFGARWGGDEFAIVAPNTVRQSKVA